MLYIFSTHLLNPPCIPQPSPTPFNYLDPTPALLKTAQNVDALAGLSQSLPLCDHLIRLNDANCHSPCLNTAQNVQQLDPLAWLENMFGIKPFTPKEPSNPLEEKSQKILPTRKGVDRVAKKKKNATPSKMKEKKQPSQKKRKLNPHFCHICGVINSKHWLPGPFKEDLCYSHGRKYIYALHKVEAGQLEEAELKEAYASRFKKHPQLMSSKKVKKIQALPDPSFFLNVKVSKLDPNRFCHICGITGKETVKWRKGPEAVDFCDHHGHSYAYWCKRAEQGKITQERVDEAFASRFARHPSEMDSKEVKNIQALAEPDYEIREIKSKLDPSRFCHICAVKKAKTWYKGPDGEDLCRSHGVKYSYWCRKTKKGKISKEKVDAAFVSRFSMHPSLMNKEELEKILALPEPVVILGGRLTKKDPYRFCHICGVATTKKWRSGPNGDDHCDSHGSKYARALKKAKAGKIPQEKVDAAFATRFLVHPNQMDPEEIKKIQAQPDPSKMLADSITQTF